MKVSDFLKLYTHDGIVNSIAESIKPNEHRYLAIKGLSGSIDAVLVAAIQKLNKQNQIIVLHDKEEAAYFHNDLQNFFAEKEVLFFPTSYKRPYEFEEVENANILMRAEILNRINHKSSTGELIVTYPEALSEKVINKKSLVKNTFSAKVGEEVDIPFLEEILSTYDFERSDFVYEAGQFSVRGGIIDIFSYAHELPYRIELFGNEIDSIRTFDPSNQLSVDKVKDIHIIPNVQTKMVEEERQSLMDYLPNNSKVWIKDFQLLTDVLDKNFKRATESFDKIAVQTGDTPVVADPEHLFDTPESFIRSIGNLIKIEFGNRFSFPKPMLFDYKTKPQPSFNKNFDLLADNLIENQDQQLHNFIVAEVPRQLDRLEDIFEEIDSNINFQGIQASFRQGFVDFNQQVVCYTDHQIFERFHRYKLKEKKSKSKALTLKELRSLKPGDYVTHIDWGIGRFAGLEKKEVNGKRQESLRLIYRDDDLLYVNIHALHKISRYSGQEGSVPSLSKLGSPEWDNKKKKAKRKMVDIAKDLISLYAKRKKATGYAFNEDSYLQAELESSFVFEDTPDQATSTADVKKDMESAHPMDRLVCGDVGFGKTEVAIRAAFKAVNDSKQVAVLVPTTILAMQHARTFEARLKDFPVNVEYINRFRSTAQIKATLANVASGRTDILIGTHRIVNKDVKFKSLGLMIIDEEQKFGVKVKEKLKETKVDVDSLTLTATPIPRTLHFSLMGARDLSVISTAPPNRQPVTTEIHVFNDVVLRDAISFELRRGGQVFFVHNRVGDIEQVANIILKLVPDARIGVAHGQMEGSKLEKVMVRFIEGEYDILVSTNIIESGLDIPNANTIIINSAHMFGLSDLHQMRGRVGRSNKKAFCFLLTPPTMGLTADARKRLKTLEEFSDLGDGFKVAMRDLDIRGAGNLLGAEQSGFINDLGFDTYHKILDETVQELKETEFKDLFQNERSDLERLSQMLVRDCVIETDLELIIPEDYVGNITERLSLYTKLDNIKDQEKLDEFRKEIEDRFGPIPASVFELTESVKLRWLAQQLGFEKIVMKAGKMKCYFVPSTKEAYYKSDIFGNVLKYVQQHQRNTKMKEVKDKLILYIQEIKNVKEAEEVLMGMRGKTLQQ